MFIFVFLPITIFFHSFIDNIKYKNIVLLIASLLFYAWGEPFWIIILLITTFVNYALSHVIERTRGTWQSKASLILALFISLGFLVIFKYSNFIVNNINIISPIKFTIPKIIMPIGISFYTFQVLSYTIDVYRRETKAQRSFFYLLMYVCLFPQLIAGPIVRYVDIEDEINHRKVTLESFSQGITRFLVGLGKKVLIANYAGKLVAELLNMNAQGNSVLGMWLGILMFSLQIYFDFSGYSDMAIGMGKMIGFNFLENFNYPYISKSVTEFWRRWHMSLSTFFRDYVYIPLGGNRKNQIRNLFIVWFLTGLWHGASWNFILWGLYYFIFLSLEKSFLLKFFKKIPSIFSRLYFFIVVLFGWVLFYFDNMTDLTNALKIMLGFAGAPVFSTTLKITFLNNYIFIFIAITACLPIIYIVKNIMEYLFTKGEIGVYTIHISNITYNIIIMFMCIASLIGSTFNPFLYFRF